MTDSNSDKNVEGLHKYQIKHLEKQKRLKDYNDVAIQGTNSSSIVSKCSVERLYLNTLDANQNIDPKKENIQYFKHFVSKPVRRSPCINRGYWLRLHAIKSRIDSIIDSSTNKVVVINLGCGYDPLPFQLLDSQNLQNSRYEGRLSFVDIDYPALIKNKINIIENTPELLSIVGNPREQSNIQVLLGTSNYVAASCNLNDSEKFESLMCYLSLNDASVTKIFVAEVSLAYMSAEKADAIIGNCSNFPNSHFTILEQLLPVGPNEAFSKQMMNHFINNNSPLLSVGTYRTIESQIKRFKSLGFPYVNGGNMSQLWDLVDPETKQKIEKVEAFDELEEFLLFGHHYVLCHATNDSGFTFDLAYKFESPPTSEETVAKVLEMDNALVKSGEKLLQRKFGASALLPNNEILYTHGSFNNRLKDTIHLSPQKLHSHLSISPSCPKERMCHSFTCLNKDLCILIGGRGGPNKPLRDTWFLRNTGESWLWMQGPDLPESRFRHQACALNETQLLIFGGVTDGSAFLIYDSEKEQFLVPPVVGHIPKRISAALSFSQSNQSGVIIGGTSSQYSVDDDMIIFHFNAATQKITLQNKFYNAQFRRYGSKSVYIGDEKILLVGGMNPKFLFGQDTTLVEVSTLTGVVTPINIPSEIWEHNAPLLAGFELQKLSTGEILVFGGGAVCYGFGSVWNGALRIGVKRSELQISPL